MKSQRCTQRDREIEVLRDTQAQASTKGHRDMHMHAVFLCLYLALQMRICACLCMPLCAECYLYVSELKCISVWGCVYFHLCASLCASEHSSLCDCLILFHFVSPMCLSPSYCLSVLVSVHSSVLVLSRCLCLTFQFPSMCVSNCGTATVFVLLSPLLPLYFLVCVCLSLWPLSCCLSLCCSFPSCEYLCVCVHETKRQV